MNKERRKEAMIVILSIVAITMVWSYHNIEFLHETEITIHRPYSYWEDGILKADINETNITVIRPTTLAKLLKR